MFKSCKYLISAAVITLSTQGFASNGAIEFDSNKRNVIHAELENGMIIDRTKEHISLTGNFSLSGNSSCKFDKRDLNGDFIQSLRNTSKIKNISFGQEILDD